MLYALPPGARRPLEPATGHRPRHAVVTHHTCWAGRRNAVARRVLLGLRDEQGDRPAHRGPSPARLGRHSRARLAVLWCPGSAPMPKLLGLYALPPATAVRVHPLRYRLAATTKSHHAEKNGPDLAGGIGVEAGTCSLGKSKSRISTSVCIVTASPSAKIGPICTSARSIAVSCTVLQKAMMRPRMLPSARVGALGRGRGHRPNGPSSKRTPGAGADVPVGRR